MSNLDFIFLFARRIFRVLALKFQQMNENTQATRLANGLTILTETMPGVRSATVGIWLRSGSRHEPMHLNGISHFIEHAVFKGTKKRTAIDIAFETDRLGGHFDAFTAHETTGFVMKVVDADLPAAFDLLADLLANPTFDERELKREQRVIIEEMKMVGDSPEESLGEIFNHAFFPDHPLGLPIEGTRKTVRTFDHAATRDFHAQAFQPSNIVVAVAGNVEHERIVEMAAGFFGSETKRGTVESASPSPMIAAPILLKKKRELEQIHLIIAAPFSDARSEERYAANLLGNVLGGGTSSRLWQEIREKRGLAYSVGASGHAFRDCGVFSVYAGTSPDKFGEVVDISIKEMRKIKREGVSIAELDLAKAQTRVSILLGLEDSTVHAEELARQEVTHGRQIPVEETLQKLEAVTPESVQALAQKYFQTEKIALAALGNFNGTKIERGRLDVS